MSNVQVATSEFSSPIPKKAPVAMPTPILGMLMFIGTEVMYFTALISSYMVISAVSPNWAPPTQVMLPVQSTALNTLVLLASGVLMVLANFKLRTDMKSAAGKSMVQWSLLLGTTFVGFQGYEWLNLISYGLTMTSGVYGGCFYLIVGSHALHAVGALIALFIMYRKMTANRLDLHSFQAMMIFWVFVVAVWPVLYTLVYLR